MASGPSAKNRRINPPMPTYLRLRTVFRAVSACFFALATAMVLVDTRTRIARVQNQSRRSVDFLRSAHRHFFTPPAQHWPHMTGRQAWRGLSAHALLPRISAGPLNSRRRCVIPFGGYVVDRTQGSNRWPCYAATAIHRRIPRRHALHRSSRTASTRSQATCSQDSFTSLLQAWLQRESAHGYATEGTTRNVWQQ